MGICVSSGSQSPGVAHSAEPATVDAGSPGGHDASPSGESQPRSLTSTTAETQKRQATNISRSQLILTHSAKIESLYDLDAGKIGEGAFGTVHKCTRKSTKAVYAVKAVSKVSVKDPEQFRQEVANMKLMDHPNIIRLFELFEDQRKVYLVMEFCTGGELFDHIVKKGHLPENEATIVMEQILRAVHYMHKLDISHRDLKPENFLYQTCRATESNVLKLIDFGLSCLSKPGTTLTTVAGTPGYVAPQVLAKNYDKRCDLWSCGAIMYTLLCGQLPFSGSSKREVLAKVRKGRYAFTSKIWQKVSGDAKALIRRLMMLNPDKRYTAEQALGHSWIRLKAQSGQSKTQMHPNLLHGLRTYQSENRLKKAALQVITKQMSDDQTKGLRDIFQSLDTDNDGTLSLAELRTGLAMAGLTEAAPDIQEIVEGLDTDGNGTVEYTEFIAAALDQESYLKEHLCWRAFNVFDLDGDGKITRQELRKVLDNGSFEREVTGAREELLQDIDGDGDGTINFEEFMAMMVRPSRGPRAS